MRKIRLRTLGFFVVLLMAAGLTAIVLRWISLEQWHRTQVAPETPVEIEIPDKTPTPAPSPKIPIIAGKLDTARLFSGITVHATVEPTPGGAASDERVDPQSYVLELKLHARVPTPNATRSSAERYALRNASGAR